MVYTSDPRETKQEVETCVVIQEPLWANLTWGGGAEQRDRPSLWSALVASVLSTATFLTTDQPAQVSSASIQ